jgi:glycosyltransferase involved in cell wall biosynthesis
VRVLALEPYYGGSHKAVLDGLAATLDVEFDVLTLPARKWKWRMRGAGIDMARRVRVLEAEGRRWDVVFASTFVNLAEFKGLVAATPSGLPSIVYFHENQLVYPNRIEREWDFHFPLANITSALAADRCLFNSRYNMEGFLDGIGPLLASFPDHVPAGVDEEIAAKSSVLPPPFDPTSFDASPATRGERPRIVWPHRWEHDKDPEAFFAAVTALAREGLDFEVAVAGQAFADTRGGFAEAGEALGEHLVHLGEPEGRADYADLLGSSDIAVSTAVNEFFGLAMVEACYAGCRPLVPDRLVYPELYPDEMRYDGGDQLVARLRALVTAPPEPYQARELGVSHLHAEIEVEGDMLLIRDLESTNGTFLNGQKIGSQGRILRHLDEVSLGGLKFIIKLDE